MEDPYAESVRMSVGIGDDEVEETVVRFERHLVDLLDGEGEADRSGPDAGPRRAAMARSK